MPLHDWSELAGWEGVHLLWMTELLHAIKGNLPPEFRALDVTLSIPVDLESTYARAAADAYLS